MDSDTPVSGPPSPASVSGGDDASVPPPVGFEDRQVVSIKSEMQRAYLDYAMSVIIGRAIPDVRDGLKPVHRRILFAMYEMKNFHNQAYKKSARVVGDVIGKYHPHGDSAVYEALVRMAQDFSMRHMLVDGQGNFGSVDGDPPAAMRYTEVRLHRLTSELLADLEKETVEWGANYDDSLQEPLVMPARFPNLLVNGSSGIAVGMATSIPPHNLREICAATVRLIRDPEVTEADLVRLVPGPDFPTGGIICGRQGCQSAALTGRGTIVVRGRVGIDEHPRSGRQALTITEIPFQVNKARLVEKIAELVREKRVQGIADLRDESDRDGIRVVVELKRDAVPQIVLNQLYKLTPLQESFGVINLSIVDGRPRVLSTRETLQYFVDHRRIVVTRRTRFELREAEARAHILEGLVKALDHIDEVVQVIRASKSPVEARSALMERFDLSERQAQAILDMRLARLTGLERDKILAELEGLRKEIARLQAILADSGLLDDVIVGELEQIAAAFGEARRTEIVSDEAELDVEDLIQREDMVVTISHQGFIKRNPLAQYRAQRRGGKGVSGMEVRQEDFVRNLFVASTHAHVLFFSNRGRVHARKVYEVPEGGRTAKGRAIVNLVGMEADEKVAAVLVVSEFAEGRFVVTATRRGYVKKTPLLDYANAVRQRGLIGLNLDEDDQLIAATVTDGAADILLGSRRGLVIRFPEAQARSMGRGSRGVRGMAIGEDDEVVSMEVVAGIGPAGEEAVGDEGDPDADAEPIEEPEEAEPEGADGEGSEALGEADAVDPGTETVLTVCANGFGKRTPVAAYRRQRRGGKGLIDIKTNERNGPVVAQLLVGDGDHIMVVSTSGTVLRCPVREVPHRGRNTMGVRLIRLADTEQIVAVERWAEAGENVGVDEAAAARVPDEGAAAPVEAPGEAAADVDATDSPPDDDES